jgi:cation transport ATPase
VFNASTDIDIASSIGEASRMEAANEVLLAMAEEELEVQTQKAQEADEVREVQTQKAQEADKEREVQTQKAQEAKEKLELQERTMQWHFIVMVKAMFRTPSFVLLMVLVTCVGDYFGIVTEPRYFVVCLYGFFVYPSLDPSGKLWRVLWSDTVDGRMLQGVVAAFVLTFMADYWFGWRFEWSNTVT